MSIQRKVVKDVFDVAIAAGDECIFTMQRGHSKGSYFYAGVVDEVRSKVKVLITQAQQGAEYSVGQEVWAYNYRLALV